MTITASPDTSWPEIAERLTNALHPLAAPIAITFLDAPPVDIPEFEAPMQATTPDGRAGRVAAGCVFWMHGAERTFSTAPADHSNCSVGSYTHGLLGLEEGDAHVIRNAGGVVTDDEIRSLAISQRLLGTEEVILIHHTDCGMLTFTDDEFKRSLQEDVGIKPAWAVETFPDLDEDVRQSIARIKASPFIPRKDAVRGFVYDVHTGDLREVEVKD